MSRAARTLAALATVALLFAPGHSIAFEADAIKQPALTAGRVAIEKPAVIEKAASASTVASRATASPSATVYGGFELASSAVVYILVRGNSLGTLGVTPNYLDAPRVRLFNSQGQDLVTDGAGQPGFNACLSSNTNTDLPVIDYYQNVRGQPTHGRDACIAVTASPGAYTFSVTPSIPGVTTSGASSIPSSGEVLFEVTLGPPGRVVDDNRSRTERLVGGTWSFVYTIISTFTDRYTFTTVTPSTAAPGDWVAAGTDEYGNLVIGTYSSRTAQWAVLDPGIIIDQFFTFTFGDNNHVSGCYYQITPPGSTNVGRCYSMAGSRFPPKQAFARPDPGQRFRKAKEARSQLQGPADPRAIEAYREARDLWMEIDGVQEAPARPPAQRVDTERSEQARDAPAIGAAAMTPKAASVRSVASRATVTSSSTVYGGFELANAANVYILVRGNSLGSLGVTQGYLDAPRVRIYNSAGQDLVTDGNSRAGFNACVAGNSLNAPVVAYYQNVRGAPVHARDACVAGSFPPGAYTFSVTPSIPGVTTTSAQSVPTFGEILFEVTLGP